METHALKQFPNCIRSEFYYIVNFKILLLNPLLIVKSFCNRGRIDEEVWRFLLTGGVALDNPHKNPAPEWLTDKSWGEIVRASKLPNLKGLLQRKKPFRMYFVFTVLMKSKLLKPVLSHFICLTYKSNLYYHKGHFRQAVNLICLEINWIKFIK